VPGSSSRPDTWRPGARADQRASPPDDGLSGDWLNLVRHSRTTQAGGCQQIDAEEHEESVHARRPSKDRSRARLAPGNSKPHSNQ